MRGPNFPGTVGWFPGMLGGSCGEAPGSAGDVGQSDMRGLAPQVTVPSPASACLGAGVARWLPIIEPRVPADRVWTRRLPTRARGVVSRWLRGSGGGPHEARQLASTRDVDDVGRLAVSAQTAVHTVQAVLGAPGDLQDVFRDVLVAAREGGATGRRAPCCRPRRRRLRPASRPDRSRPARSGRSRASSAWRPR